MRIHTKLIIAIGSVLVVAVSLVEIHDFRQSLDSIREKALSDARDIHSMIIAVRQVYEHQFADEAQLVNAQDSDLPPGHSGQRIAENFAQLSDSGLSFRNVSDRPRNLLNQADEAELAAMDWFRQQRGANERLVEITSPEGQQFFHYATPIRIEAACLKCHGEDPEVPTTRSELYAPGFGYQLGDLRGIVSIKIPFKPLKDRIHAQQIGESAGLMVSIVLILVVIAILLHYLIIQRLNLLKEAAETIANGDLHARVPESGNDELASLARSFNRMSNALQRRDQQLASQSQRLEKLAREQELLLNHTNDVVFHHDMDGRISYISPAVERICGHPRTAWLDHFSRHMTSSPINQNVQKNTQAALDTGLAQPAYLVEVQHQDGHAITLEINESPVLEGGKVIGLIGVARDVSERLRADRALRDEHAFLQRVIDGVGDPIMVIGVDYSIQLMNKAAQAHCPTPLIGQTRLCCYQVSHHADTPCDGTLDPCPLQMVLETGEPVAVVHQHPMADGTQHSYELIATPLFDQQGKISGIIESSRDITLRLKVESDLHQQEQNLEHLAHHDLLTDLPNRLLFGDRLEQALHRAHRAQQRLALLYIDLDHFKKINDSLGHAKGDLLLKQVAKRLSVGLREDDTISRLGGDEFALIVESLTDYEDAGLVAKKALQTFDEPFDLPGHSLFVNASIGISLYPRDASDSMSLLRNADAAMYKAKNEGRNTFCFYTPDLTKRALERVLMEAELREALRQHQLSIYYQPQACLETGRLCGLEALVRWQHPKLGIILPSRFIPLAEETGMIEQIGEFVLRESCQQMRRWLDAGYQPGRVAVNLSSKQIHVEKIVGWVSRILQETDCPASALELEITESYLMSEPDKAVIVLRELRSLGIELAIDDFGTGYSSLAYLKNLPISKLKIDASFIRDITEDPSDMAITQSIIGLGRSLNLKVLAEGVETESQRALLARDGCGQIQGFLYARPMPADQLEALLQQERIAPASYQSAPD